MFSSGVKFTINGQPTNSYDPATFYEGEIEGIYMYSVVLTFLISTNFYNPATFYVEVHIQCIMEI